jgi:hypothetical protein
LDILYHNSDSAKIDIVQHSLLDCVTYAKIYTDFDAGDVAHLKIQNDAILRTYRRINPKQIFMEFFQDKSLTRLDKKLSNFIDKVLMPYVKNHKPNENSLGLRAFNILTTDTARQDITDQQRAELNKANAEYINNLIHALQV